MAEERLVIMVSDKVSRGKAAAAAVHAALLAEGIHRGQAVIVLTGTPTRIEREATTGVVVRDAGRTEVEPGTVTAGVLRHDNPPPRRKSLAWWRSR